MGSCGKWSLGFECVFLEICQSKIIVEVLMGFLKFHGTVEYRFDVVVCSFRIRRTFRTVKCFLN